MARGSFFTVEQIGPKQSRTPEGFLLCEDVPLARTGMMIYGPNETPIEAGEEGIVKVFRDPEDVFHPDTIGSCNGKSVVNDHPEVDVVPDNWKELTVGMCLNPRRGEGPMDDLLIGDLLITDPEGIKAVLSGKREISLGYDADYEETSKGVGKQSNILINHIALVEQGRCGPRCAIRDQRPELTNKGVAMTAKKSSRVLDFLMRAFKAKDAEEVERLAEEVAKDEAISGVEGGEGDTHVHVHMGSEKDSSEAGVRTYDDEAIQAHIEQNAAEHEAMSSRIAALEELVSKLSTAESQEQAMDEEERAATEAMLDEVPEEVKAEAAKAKDSAFMDRPFKSVVADAEILVPGIGVPTFDRAAKPTASMKQICNMRRNALDLAYAQPATRTLISDLLQGKKLDTSSMTCDAARVLFNSAVAAKKAVNSAPRAAAHDGASKAEKKGVKTLAELNALNAQRYNK